MTTRYTPEGGHGIGEVEIICDFCGEETTYSDLKLPNGWQSVDMTGREGTVAGQEITGRIAVDICRNCLNETGLSGGSLIFAILDRMGGAKPGSENQ